MTFQKQAVASGHTRTTPAPASAGAPTPKPQVTSAGSAKPPGDDGSAPVMQFLAGIGLGHSHFQILTQEGIRTQRDLDDLQKLEKDSIVELMDVLRARGFTAFEFSKFLYTVRCFTRFLTGEKKSELFLPRSCLGRRINHFIALVVQSKFVLVSQ